MNSQTSKKEDDSCPEEPGQASELQATGGWVGGYVQLGDLVLAVAPLGSDIAQQITRGTTPLGGSANVGFNGLRQFLAGKEWDSASLSQAMCMVVGMDRAGLCPHLIPTK